MALPSASPATVCNGKPCQRFSPGHNMHHIHARRVGDRPWGWRDALVANVVGREIHLSYVNPGEPHEPGQPVVWHHGDLSDLLSVGTPVRLHEQYYAMGLPAGWINVIILSGGRGPVPEPNETQLWLPEMTVGVSSSVTGHGLPMDHPAGDHS